MMLDFPEDLTSEELRDALCFVEYAREVRAKGYRPVVAASKGSKTKLLKGGDSTIAFVDELLASDIFAAIRKPDLRAKAKLRGLKAREAMLGYQGTPWKSDLVASYLKISVQMVSRKRRQAEIFGLSYGKKEYLYPAWQFSEDGILPGLKKVLAVLEDNLVPDWDKLRFFTSSRSDSESTPVCLLQAGHCDRVVADARTYGKQI